MTNTFTPEHRTKLEEYLSNHDLPKGLGSEESACSIAAINLAISGKLTDDIPSCMSKVLGKATIRLQDAMPYAMRNSERYKRLLPDMAGTGREKEQERLAVLMDWMWNTILPQLQPHADKYGFGMEWQEMCDVQTAQAAATAAAAATYAVSAAHAADGAARAARAANAAAAHAAAYAADGAARAARAAAAYAADSFWKDVDPIGVLEKMTYLEKQND